MNALPAGHNSIQYAEIQYKDQKHGFGLYTDMNVEEFKVLLKTFFQLKNNPVGFKRSDGVVVPLSLACPNPEVLSQHTCTLLLDQEESPLPPIHDMYIPFAKAFSKKDKSESARDKATRKRTSDLARKCKSRLTIKRTTSCGDDISVDDNSSDASPWGVKHQRIASIASTDSNDIPPVAGFSSSGHSFGEDDEKFILEEILHFLDTEKDCADAADTASVSSHSTHNTTSTCSSSSSSSSSYRYQGITQKESLKKSFYASSTFESKEDWRDKDACIRLTSIDRNISTDSCDGEFCVSFPDEVQLELKKSIDSHIFLLNHLSTCTSSACSFDSCRNMKVLLEHESTCTIKVKNGCASCMSLINILSLHARKCKEPNCNIPHCKEFREHYITCYSCAERLKTVLRKKDIDEDCHTILNEMYCCLYGSASL